MSFNRRGGPDRRPDRPRREGFGDRPGGRGPYAPRPPRDGGDRPYGDRPQGDRQYGDRPYGGRPQQQPRRSFDRPPDEGAMSIRLDPRRVGALKRLAGDAGVRPGDLVRQWVEERIDAARIGPDGLTLEQRLEALDARVAALEGSATATGRSSDEPVGAEPGSSADKTTEPEADEAVEPAAADDDPAPEEAEAPPTRRGSVSAAPTGRVALHDEMIAVLSERGPMTTGDLAAAIAERGRYAPPRSGKPLDAAMVSQRASNPTYRARFRRREGRIGLAEAENAE